MFMASRQDGQHRAEGLALIIAQLHRPMNRRLDGLCQT